MKLGDEYKNYYMAAKHLLLTVCIKSSIFSFKYTSDAGKQLNSQVAESVT